MSQPKEKESESRRQFLKYGAAVVVGAAAAAAGYSVYQSSQAPPTPVGPTTVTQIQTQAPATVTAPSPVVLRGYVHAIDPNAMTAASINKWNAENPGKPFVPIAMPAGGAQDITYKTEASLLAAKSPDLDCPNIDISWTSVMAENGWLEPLDDVFPPEEHKKFIPAGVEANTWKGHVYAIQYFPDTLGMWYRKDVFEKEGIKVANNGKDWTWDEFYNILANLKSKYPSMYPISIDLSKSGELMNGWSMQMYTAGAGLFDNDGLVRIDDADGMAAAQSLWDMHNKYKLTHPEALTGGLEVGRILFTDEGKTIVNQNWDYVWGMSLAKTSVVEGKIERALPPHQPGKDLLGRDRRGGPLMGGWQWAVSAATRNKKEAKEFVLWETSYDTMKYIMMGGGFSQARLALYDDPDVQKVWTPSAAMKLNFENAYPKFKTIYYPQIQAVVQDQMSAALAMQKSPQEAQTAIAEEVMNITGQGRSPLVKK